MRLHLVDIDAPDPETGYEPEFLQFENRIFENERVPVDNHQYRHCTFRNCVLVYSGGPYGFDECVVAGDIHVALTGAANRSLELWQAFQDHIQERMPPTGA
jgi:hypothetical protein